MYNFSILTFTDYMKANVDLSIPEVRRLPFNPNLSQSYNSQSLKSLYL